jgi:opacity protein-like surface antigen
MEYPNFKTRQKSALYKILVFVTAFLLGALPADALTEGPYFTLNGSIDMFSDLTLTGKVDSSVPSGTTIEKETGFGFSHAIGYQFKNSFSTEIEFSYKAGDFGPSLAGDTTSKSFLVNGIYSFNIREFYTPYIGYGMGFAFHEASIVGNGNREDTTLAYQLKTGIDVEFSRKLSMLLGYKYFTTNNPNFKGYFTAETPSHSLEAGLKFHF